MANPGVTIDMRGRNAQLRATFAESLRDVLKFKQSVSGIGERLAGVFSVGALVGGFKALVDYGDKIADLSQRFGVSTDILQKWGEAAEENGSSLESLAGGFNKLIINQSKALAGDTELRTAFENLGVSIDELQSMSPEQLMEEISRGGMDAADVVAVLGRNAVELIPTLQAVADGSANMGAVMSNEAVQGLGKLSDGFKQAKQMALALAGEGFAAVFRQAENLAAWLTGTRDQLDAERALDEQRVADELKPVDREAKPDERKKADAAADAGLKVEEQKRKLIEETAEIRRKDALHALDDAKQLAALNQEITDKLNEQATAEGLRSAELGKEIAQLESHRNTLKDSIDKNSDQEQEKANQLDAEAHEEQAKRAAQFDEKAAKAADDQAAKDAEARQKKIDEAAKPADQRRSEKRERERKDRIGRAIDKAKDPRSDADKETDARRAKKRAEAGGGADKKEPAGKDPIASSIDAFKQVMDQKYDLLAQAVRDGALSE